MNNLYYKLLGEKVIDCPQIKVSTAVDNQIKDAVVSILGLRDIGQLRDKFEGQAYLDEIILKIQSHNACLKYLGLLGPQINQEYVEKFKPIIRFEDGGMLVVVPFRIETLPRLRIIDYKQPRIFVLHKGELIYSILGVASIEMLNDRSNFANIDKSGLEGDFIGFDKLKIAST